MSGTASAVTNYAPLILKSWARRRKRVQERQKAYQESKNKE